MILRDHDVEPALAGLHEHGIAGPRAGCVYTFVAGRLNRRTDDVDFLVSEETSLAGMRIETGDRDAGVSDPERLRARMGQPDRVHLRRKIAFPDCVGQRTMDGDEDSTNILVRQHHGDFDSPSTIGQDFSVAGIGQTGGGERFFVHSAP